MQEEINPPLGAHDLLYSFFGIGALGSRFKALPAGGGAVAPGSAESWVKKKKKSK